MKNIETTAEFSRLKSISSKVLKITVRFILAIYLFSRVSLHLQRKTIILGCEEKVYKNWI